ncbi:MAG TPA: hypothetical protein VFJ72_02545 [Rubrobacteraceae bacterium]|nr:hypothetical protein [Rubrobacteraceae bacterium]
MFLRLMGVGALYGFGFALIKSLFPSPVILLAFSDAPTGEGSPAALMLVYMGTGLVAGFVAAFVFGGILLARRGATDESSSYYGPRFALSMILALLMGLISGLLTIVAYASGILPAGGVLDPLKLIRASNFSPGTPLLVAWTIARDLLPAGLTGLFLSPVGGGMLMRLYAADRPPVQKTYEDFE